MRKPLFLGFVLALFVGTFAGLCAQTQNASPQPKETGNAAAAAKPAARRKEFEELKAHLENGGVRSSSSGKEEPAPGLLISPVQVGMLIHEEQKFSLLDIQGHNLKEKAEWSLSNSYVADLVDGDVPTLIAKDTGTVTLRARLGNLTGEAEVKVYPGDKLPMGTIRWAAPKIPGYTTTQVLRLPRLRRALLHRPNQNPDSPGF